ncbi:MAG: zinc-ribbon domain containing protein, partial [Acidobacteriota bacterium]
MMQQYTDKNLTCVDCGNTFLFSADDQEFYARKDGPFISGVRRSSASSVSGTSRCARDLMKSTEQLNPIRYSHVPKLDR